MKTAAIVAALVATFNSALADVVCNSETLHYKPRMVSTAEKDGFSRTIDEVCNDSIDKSLQRQFESTVFSRTRTENSFSEEECIANLHSVLEKCIFGKNARGGSLVTNELMVEVSLDPSNDRHEGAAEKRANKPSGSKPISKPKPKPKPVPVKPAPAKPVPAKPAPVKPTPAKPTPVKTPPAGQACKLKPGKGKGNGTGKGGNKTPTKVIRDLISKLFPRAGSDSGCDLEDMTDGGEWGTDTWRGVKLLISNTMTNKALRDVAKAAFDEVMPKRKVSGGIVVAALFVPGRGVYIGTPAHGNGPKKVESFAQTKATFWWDLMQYREWDGKGSKYHAEDVAMLLAIESGAAKGDSKFPPGSKIAAWGRVGNMPTDKAMQPCTNGNILPGCMENIGDMGIESAYSG